MSELAFPIPAELVEAIAVRVAELVLERAPAEADPGHLLSTDEAAAWFGRSTRWVRDRVKAGELPHVRLDAGPPRFKLTDLERFADERRIACNPLAGVPLSRDF